MALAMASQAWGAEVQKLDVQAVPTTPMAGTFTIAAVGDLIYLRPMLRTIEARSPGMLKILRDADVAFGNFETTILDLTTFRGSPQAEAGGTWMLGDPGAPADLAKMGFDIVSHANNHVTDWGVEGLAETDHRLDEAGLVHAGSGASLSAARAPRYLDLAAGRISLVAATSSFTPMSRAADGLGEIPARAGVNALRTDRTRLVTAEDLPAFARAAKIEASKPIVLDGIRYQATANPALVATLSYEVNAKDEAANLLSVRQARQNSNFTVFSLHNHEPGNWSQAPSDFAPAFAHKVIDEGADAFVGHGPHQLRGIEIYKGKPIFYSLGNFAMMNNSLDVVPPDMYEQYGVTPGSATTPEMLQARNAKRFADTELYESVIALSRYQDGKLAEIRLYPIDLGADLQGAGRGVPTLASPAEAQKILERLLRLSKPFGTEIAIEKGVGVIRIPASSAR